MQTSGCFLLRQLREEEFQDKKKHMQGNLIILVAKSNC